MTKCPPGKRICKKCCKFIPIHSRFCPFCHEQIYSYEQIDKEYKKRNHDSEEGSDDVSDWKQYKGMLKEPNPFAASTPIVSLEIAAGPQCAPVAVQLGKMTCALDAQQSLEHDGLLLLSPGGRVTAMSWAYTLFAPHFLAFAVQHDLQHLEYGRVYDGEGWVHFWEFGATSSWAFSLRHPGKALHDLKWLPAYSTHTSMIGTLLQATSSGLIQLINVPRASQGYYEVEAIETFAVPGLVFQSLAWLREKHRFAAGSQDGSILVFQSGCASPVVAIWGAHALPVTALSLSYKHNQLSSCSLDGLLKLWDPESGACRDTVCSNKRWNYHVAWHPFGNYLFFDNDGITSPHKVVKFEGDKCLDKKHVNVSREATLCTSYSVRSGYAYIASSDGRISAVYLQELAKTIKKRKRPWSRHLEVITVAATEDVLRVEKAHKACAFEENAQLKNGARMSISPQEQAITHVDVCARSKEDELLAFAVWGGLVGVRCMRRAEM